jgi:hypothetical protein
MQVSIHITEDQTAALAKLKDAGAKMLGPLASAWHSGMLEVLGKAVKGRFTGKGPFPVSQNRLGVVTNRLRKSLRCTAPQIESASGAVSVSTGSNVSYFAGHEFGFKGTVQVRGHTRRAVANDARNVRGRITRKAESQIKGRIKSGRSNTSFVRPHARKVNIPARRPLGTELDSISTRLTMWKKVKAVLNRFLSLKA